MTKYLISFDDAAMVFTEEELPAIAKAASDVGEEATAAGVWVFGGGLNYEVETSTVAPDGSVTDGPYPEAKERLGGFAVVDVPTLEAAQEWASKIAVACRCPQRVRQFLPDPTFD
ncbi:YciI family protein [Luteipulveratus mongoliensis]|uniref:YCII-related domain-containing protein n=1 Tax=Luteipulveratus mongoliensis TaxID=571913 RepID=A0A0K1JFH9_9MICO|nr:YciI family protein [Luteipulveratus mongoliensis]AKU15464.1 hypothetical protein VV02_05590 [Luteipulveratus mongoliensis]